MKSDPKENLLIIFIKNPQKGAVKRRLAKEIGEDRALEIYQALLEKTKQVTLEGDYTKAVFYSEEIDQNDIWPENEYLKFTQEGSNMGERMLNAFKTGFRKGFQRVVLIGGDIVNLTTINISKAFSALENENFVLGPATDGGYYLIGMTSLYEALFKNKDWGQESVFKMTRDQIRQKGFEVIILDACSDIDTVDDFRNFQKTIFKSGTFKKSKY